MAFDPEFSTTHNFGYQRLFQTTLSSSITASTTAIPLTSLPTPTEGFLVIEPGTSNAEVIFYNSSGAGVVNVPSAADGRGTYSTTAIAHNSGVTVKMVNEAGLWEVLQDQGAMSLKFKQDWKPLKLAGTYVSASSFTVSGDVTNIVEKGTKLYLNNSGDKYFIVSATPTYSGGTGLTTISVTAGTTYTVANAAISSIYFSNVAKPFGFPTSFDWSPAPTGFSSAPSSVTAKFWTVGRTCFFTYYAAVDGTSNSTAKTYTLPITSAAGSGAMFIQVTTCKDNGTNAAGRHQISFNSSTVNCYPTITGGTWTGSGTCNHVADGISVSYPI